MKKVTALLLALLFVLSLAACGKDSDGGDSHDYSKHQIDYFSEADGFSWDMTRGEAYDFIKRLQKDAGYSREIERDVYSDSAILSDGVYVMRFGGGKNGKLEFIKQKDSGAKTLLASQYGTWDEYDSKNDTYTWYGTMAGRKITMKVGYGYIEFEPVD